MVVPYTDSSILLMASGMKLARHGHLAAVDIRIDIRRLENSSRTVAGITLCQDRRQTRNWFRVWSKVFPLIHLKECSKYSKFSLKLTAFCMNFVPVFCAAFLSFCRQLIFASHFTSVVAAMEKHKILDMSQHGAVARAGVQASLRMIAEVMDDPRVPGQELHLFATCPKPLTPRSTGRRPSAGGAWACLKTWSGCWLESIQGAMHHG